MKGTVYGDRLPRGRQVEKGWKPLLWSFVMHIKDDNLLELRNLI
jgi:hypothetical protein